MSAANFQDAVIAAYNAGTSMPAFWSGVAPEGTQRTYPYAVLGDVTETQKSYDSKGNLNYWRGQATLTVYGDTEDGCRTAAATVLGQFGPNGLTVTGKTARLYVGDYVVKKTGDRTAGGGYAFAAAIPLDAEIS